MDGIRELSTNNQILWDENALGLTASASAFNLLATNVGRVFGPDNAPIVQVGYLGLVEVDAAFRITPSRLDDYERTATAGVISQIYQLASDIKKRGVKIAIFSSTPQGGGVALMRHALIRHNHYLGVDMKWYVPKPRPGVFNVTKTSHNILQGISRPGQRLTANDHALVVHWMQENAKRYWLRPGGPMRKPSEGGADFIIIDDPQMPALIQIAKQIAPNRPVIYRSHIQMRSDLIDIPGSPQEDVWNWIWQYIQKADIFISHPVSSFVPSCIPREKVGYMPATTDWLDGLNKPLRDWDIAFYGRNFNSWCRSIDMPTIDYPDDEYVIQVARFDPSKGIPDLLEAYEKFHERLTNTFPDMQPPKLLICGHSSIDDPEGTKVYDSAVAHIEHDIPHIRDFVCVMRVRPSDQVLNALISKAKIALQLSTREGFEVKVSEALHKGKPVIATKAGGIPLQIQHEKNGFLVEVGDTDAVARHLFELWTDQDLYNRMSEYAFNNISDEVSTAGGTLDWLYLASKMTKGEDVKPNGRWIHDVAREEALDGQTDDEIKLKRDL